MAKGISLHIGLNRVDPAAYNGWAGTLAGCENDARSMKQIADACGYSSRIMLNDQATSAAVCEAIGQTAQDLAAGDYFLLSYSGHGGQVEDCNGDDRNHQLQHAEAGDSMFAHFMGCVRGSKDSRWGTRSDVGAARIHCNAIVVRGH